MKVLFIILGFVFAGIAIIYADQIIYGQIEQETAINYDGPDMVAMAGSGIDVGADGGAAGFAILSGFCFLSAAVTSLRDKKEGTDKKQKEFHDVGNA